MSYIYIIQVPEHSKTGEAVYKIGKTEQEPSKRLAGYPKGTIVYLIINVDNCHTAEKDLLLLFNRAFQRKTEHGTEYFAGNVIQMINLVYSYFLDHPPLCHVKDDPEWELHRAEEEELKRIKAANEELERQERERQRAEEKERERLKHERQERERQERERKYLVELMNFNNVKNELYNALQSLYQFNRLVPNLMHELETNNFKDICKQFMKYRKNTWHQTNGSMLVSRIQFCINMLNITLDLFNRLYNKKEPMIELMSEFEIRRLQVFGVGGRYESENTYFKVKTMEDCAKAIQQMSTDVTNSVEINRKIVNDALIYRR
jgi:hypothetical protein